jgi:hypothetical protein
VSSETTSSSTPQDYAITAIRSVVAAAPFVGGLLNETLFDHRNRLKQRRLEEFVNQLSEDVALLKVEATLVERLQSEEFSDLLESAARRAVLTSNTQKRQRLRQVVLRQIEAPQPTDFSDIFLDLISELSEKQIEILSAFRNAAEEAEKRVGEARNYPFVGPFRAGQHYDLGEQQFRIMVLHLVARGLLYDDGLGRWGTAAQQFFEITALGRAFLEFLQHPTE